MNRAGGSSTTKLAPPPYLISYGCGHHTYPAGWRPKRAQAPAARAPCYARQTARKDAPGCSPERPARCLQSAPQLWRRRCDKAQCAPRSCHLSALSMPQSVAQQAANHLGDDVLGNVHARRLRNLFDQLTPWLVADGLKAFSASSRPSVEPRPQRFLQRARAARPATMCRQCCSCSASL